MAKQTPKSLPKPERKKKNHTTKSPRDIGMIYLIISMVGLSAGICLCLAGLVITVLGISGSIEWLVQGQGLKSKLSNAGPGVLFAILGTIIVWRFRPHIENKIHKTEKSETETLKLFSSDDPATPAGRRRAIGEAIKFADSNLEAAIRVSLGRTTGEIGKLELESLIDLDLNDKNISSLSGLEACTNLELLAIQDNSIHDITPLAGLVKLKTLSLNGNPVSDITPLAKLTELNFLYLGKMKLSGLQPLEFLAKLELLSLAYSEVPSLGPLIVNQLRGGFRGSKIILWGTKTGDDSIGAVTALSGTADVQR